MIRVFFITALVAFTACASRKPQGAPVSSMRGAEAIETVLAMLPANCKVVLWANFRAFFGPRGIVERHLAGKADAPSSATPPGVRSKVDEGVADRATAEFKRLAKEQLGVDPDSAELVLLAHCGGGTLTFLDGAATAKTKELQTGARRIGPHIVFANPPALLAEVDADMAAGKLRLRGKPSLARTVARLRTAPLPVAGAVLLDSLFGVEAGLLALTERKDRLRLVAATTTADAVLAKWETELGALLRLSRESLDGKGTGPIAELFQHPQIAWLARRVLGAASISRAGDWLEVSFDGDLETMANVAGVVSAIAIPAFMKSLRRPTESEATMDVRKLYDSAVSYYEEEFASPDGKTLPRHFPATIEWTPAGTACDFPGRKFPVAGTDLRIPANTWNANKTWNALNFSVDDPHHYSYQFVSAGTGAKASFTARARGDLKCRGVFSYFERKGTVDGQGNVQGGIGLERYEGKADLSSEAPRAIPAPPAAATAPADGSKEDVSSEEPKAEGSSAGLVGSLDDAKVLLKRFVDPNTDRAALTKSLRPKAADYAAVFQGDAATRAEKYYAKLWSDPRAVIGANADQMELLVWAATSDEIKAGTGHADKFPGGYREAVAHFRPGVTVYRWKFVKPGETLGMAYDGLVYVNGRWVWFPKPWRALKPQP